MNIREKQICDKLLSEISVAYELTADLSREEFVQDERTARAVCKRLSISANWSREYRRSCGLLTGTFHGVLLPVCVT